MRTAPARWVWIAAFLFASGLVACGDDKVVAVGGGPPPDAWTDAPVTDVPPGTDAIDDSGKPIDPGPVETKREIILLHDVTAPHQLVITENFLIRAKVLDYTIPGPAPSALVNYTIVESPTDGDASLTTSQAYTDDNGEVAVTFRANYLVDAAYTVELTANNAEPVRIKFYVTDAPKGDIRVKVAYEGSIAVKNVHVRLLQGVYTCSQFKATSIPLDIIGEKTLLGLGTESSVVFKNLPEAKKFTAIATAVSPKGSLAAAGCVDGVLVVPGAENAVTLTMHLLTLNPAGLYDTVNIFDFTGAIPGELGELIDEIVLLFNDPGQFIINQVKKLAAQWVGELITNIAFGLFEDAVSDWITGWLLNDSPDWVQDIFTIGQDLTQVVNNLEMQADLVISKLSNDFYVQGVLNWKGIVLYWKLGCAKEGQPGYDPECGKNVFSLDAFSNTQFPMDIIQGKFTGFIHDFDQLEIDNHIIKINYGKLIIFVLNEMILPAITGENNLTDAVIKLINCKGLGGGITGDILKALGLNSNAVEGFCVDAITLLVKPVEVLIGGLALDSQLRLSGKAVMVDNDNDLRVDEIIEGVYLGHMEQDGQQGPPFSGIWDAVKTTP